MSRIRSVHPGFFRDDRLVPCSAFARLLFIGLGVEADDKGIFEWKPVTIKMSVFPGDSVDVVSLLAELEEADAIRQFDIGGRKFGAIRNFRKYQKPKSPNDVHPMPGDIAEYVALPQSGETNSDKDGTFPQKGENQFQMEEGGGSRREEMPSSPEDKTDSPSGPRSAAPSREPQRRGTRLPANWTLPQPWGEWARAEFPSLPADKIRREADAFRDYWVAKPGSAGVKLDWEATWRNWIRKIAPQAPARFERWQDDPEMRGVL
jgi:hypothetical protein